MAKKILILAGTYFQIPVIEYAKMKGHYVITCDNRPDNPGHRISDEYFNLSTTDIKGVLDLAENMNIDGILAFGTDPAAPTAAFVSEKLNLPGNSYSSVQTFSDKGLFRKFLSENNFPVPVSEVFRTYNEANIFYKTLKGNVFVKPVDSSGSKGISKLKPGSELKTAFFHALEFSRKREIIIEEEIRRYGPHIHGEAFIYKGEVVFCLFGDQYFSRVTETAPMSTTVPSIFHSDIMPGIKNELSRIIELTGFNTGGLNVELIRGDDDRIYFVEIGSRSGGNFMPELIRQASGFDLAAASVNAALNEPVDLRNHSGKDQFWTQLILHSPMDGIFSGYDLSLYRDNMIFKKEYYSPGDKVHAYRDSRHVMGVHIYHFDERSLYNMFLDYIMANDLVFVN